MTAPLIPRLTTERLLLREWLESDREPFAELNADPEVALYLGEPMSHDASDALIDRIQARWAADGHGLWALERRDSGEFIGFVGLAAPSWDAPFTPCVEVGWRLARAAWGSGFATEGAAAAVDYGFDTLGLDEIVSFTTVANARSRAVMERLGMVRDPADDFLHPRLPEGNPLRPHVLYRLSADRWRRVRGRLPS